MIRFLVFILPSVVQCFQIPLHNTFTPKINSLNNGIVNQPKTALNIAPQDIDIESTVSSSILLSKDFSALIKPILISLTLGGGLIPALISANSAMAQTLSGKRVDDNGNEIIRIPSSASGPTIPVLLASDKVPLVEVIAVIGRIADVNSLADWRNLPSTKVPNAIDPNNPPMWLPRATFKENMRKARFLSWPLDPKTNLPIGGEELKKEYEPLLKSNKLPIGDAALDAVWDTWAGGASIATPDKVKAELNSWKPDEYFSLGGFIGATVRGRSITLLGAITFIVIQVVALGSIFIAPALRVLLDVDIGFGQMGQCSPEGCVKLLDMF